MTCIRDAGASLVSARRNFHRLRLTHPESGRRTSAPIVLRDSRFNLAKNRNANVDGKDVMVEGVARAQRVDKPSKLVFDHMTGMHIHPMVHINAVMDGVWRDGAIGRCVRTQDSRTATQHHLELESTSRASYKQMKESPADPELAKKAAPLVKKALPTTGASLTRILNVLGSPSADHAQILRQLVKGMGEIVLGKLRGAGLRLTARVCDGEVH